jgi:putative NADPH-quinone reductase
MANVVVILGHPDSSPDRLCRALADACVEGARGGGHHVDYIDVAKLDFPLLRDVEDWMKGVDGTPESLKSAQAACIAADHLVLIYPLWLGTMPALLKAFLEQVFRPGVALSYADGFPKGLFKGKSARIVVTMGMPAFAYRWYYLAHSLKSLERNILGLCGVRPIRSTLIGMVETLSREKRRAWIEEMKTLGKRAG